MTKQEKLNKATALIKELVPSIKVETKTEYAGNGEVSFEKEIVHIHLEDVLLAMEVKEGNVVNHGDFYRTMIFYIKSNPFSNQSKEFYEFLIKTLS